MMGSMMDSFRGIGGGERGGEQGDLGQKLANSKFSDLFLLFLLP